MHAEFGELNKLMMNSNGYVVELVLDLLDVGYWLPS